MKLRPVFVAIVFALPGGAFGQEAQPASVYKLKNVAASDVAQSVTTHAVQQKLEVTVVAEPVSNRLVVIGDAAAQKRVAGLLAALDQPLPMVVVAMIIVEAPADFAKDSGLGDGDKWVLTPREARMLTAAIRREKEKGRMDVLSRPILHLTDNRTGFMQIGNEGEYYSIHTTPQLSPKGDSVSLKIQAQFTKAKAGSTAPGETVTPVAYKGIDSTECAESIPTGGTLVVRCVRRESGKEARDIFLIMVPTAVEK